MAYWVVIWSLVVQSNRKSIDLKWWALSQRIRTFARVPIDAAILETDAAPIYQQIAPKTVHLQQLGMNSLAIAKLLGVTDKTVAKAIAWYGRMQRNPDG